jgi:putative addiction module component (TIGR02574 family)
MASNLELPPPGFDDLPVEERIEYVQILWDRISAKPGDVPVPDWHRQVVRDRIASYQRSPEDGRPWSEVRDALLRKLRSRSD